MSAFPIKSLCKNDLTPIVEIIEKQLISEKFNIYEEKDKYDWNSLIQETYYALGGDYPDEESVDVALLYSKSCLRRLQNMVYQLSESDLHKCLNDIMKVISKLND